MLAPFEEYHDFRLVAIYDDWDRGRSDITFYLDLAEERGALEVADVGCGTGLLACELALRGHNVTAVDPSEEMIAFARKRKGGSRVRWLRGDARLLPEDTFHLVVMSGHVAQIIADESEWQATLIACSNSLKPGGLVAFESRNPEAREWESWADRWKRRLTTRTGPVDVWYTPTLVESDRVAGEIHYLFVSNGEEITSHNELRFRSLANLMESLKQNGFSVLSVYGDHNKAKLTQDSPEFVFVAARAPSG